MKIVAEASPYCFGSTSVLLSIAKQLSEEHSISIICDKIVSKQFHSHKELFDSIRVEEFSDEKKYSKNEDLIKNADLYISVMNWIGLKKIKELDKKFVYIDILFWKNDAVTYSMKNADYYLLESYPNVKKDLRKFSSKINNPIIVNPLFDRGIKNEPNGKENKVMVNLGGGESPLIKPNKNSRYGELILKILKELDYGGMFSKYNEINICSGRKRIEELKDVSDIFPKPNFKSLPHKEYIDELSKSKIFLTSPGLNGPYEGFYLDIPTFFLPPQNLTQIFHLKDYIEYGLAPKEISYKKYFPDFDINKQFDEEREISRVLNKIDEVIEKEEIIKNISEVILQDFKSKNFNEKIGLQKKYLDDLNIGKNISKVLNQIISRKKCDI